MTNKRFSLILIKFRKKLFYDTSLICYKVILVLYYKNIINRDVYLYVNINFDLSRISLCLNKYKIEKSNVFGNLYDS